jgi:hypothetical protein
MTSNTDKKIVMAEETKLQKAYEQWRSTGILTTNKATVKALYYKFKTIADVSSSIPEYKLMSNDAINNAFRLRDIIVARYGKEEAQNL